MKVAPAVITPVGTLPFPRRCAFCGGEVVVYRQEPVDELVITRFWLFECIRAWCLHRGTMTMIRPPGFYDDPDLPMPGL